MWNVFILNGLKKSESTKKNIWLAFLEIKVYQYWSAFFKIYNKIKWFNCVIFFELTNINQIQKVWL